LACRGEFVTATRQFLNNKIAGASWRDAIDLTAAVDITLKILKILVILIKSAISRPKIYNEMPTAALVKYIATHRLLL
jgi:hypothetical protein